MIFDNILIYHILKSQICLLLVIFSIRHVMFHLGLKCVFDRSVSQNTRRKLVVHQKLKLLMALKFLVDRRKDWKN